MYFLPVLSDMTRPMFRRNVPRPSFFALNPDTHNALEDNRRSGRGESRNPNHCGSYAAVLLPNPPVRSCCMHGADGG